MKISRQLLGKLVELTWKDPCEDRVKCHLPNLEDLPKGRAALATWKERGVIDDITDGVVRLVQSEGHEPGAGKPDEFKCQWICEELIEAVRVAEFQAVESGTG